MGATPFKSVTWTDEPVATQKLNAMANNEQWLYENMPRMYYNANGIKRTTGVKVLTGTAYVGASQNDHTGTAVYFGSYFSAGCKPVVVAGLNAYPQGRLHVVTRGIGVLIPDNRGFEVRVYANEVNYKNNRLVSGVYVPYIAIGW